MQLAISNVIVPSIARSCQALAAKRARPYKESIGKGGIYNQVNFNLYHYAGIGQRSDSELQANNPIKYIDPTGMWVDNEDGTYTAEKDDTLWGLAQEIFGDGSRWEEFGYEGDPTKLQVGDTVGKQKTATITHEQNSSLAILEVPDITQKTGGYDIVAGAELIGLGASLATAGGVAGSETIAAIGAGTISAGGAVAGVVTTGFFVLLGGTMIFMGIDLMSGDGLDRTENLINNFLKKED